tara:strand:+ start:4457 stop:4684 length:228 start_codon:yes stop_codon:yes gene_type:complete
LLYIHVNFKEAEGIKIPWHNTTLSVLAITLHNIPEGLAIGVFLLEPLLVSMLLLLVVQLFWLSELDYRIYQKDLL